MPLFVTETRYYRQVLGISWEFGMRLRKAGVLRPDAQLDSGGVLYLLTPERLRATEAAIARYRSGVSQTKEPIYA